MSYTLKLTPNQINILHTRFYNNLLDNTNQYVYFRFSFKKAVITVYKTNKVLIQGQDESSANEMICEILGLEFREDESKKFNDPISITHSTIGSDEVGTGDFFGSIVVCACFVPSNMEKEVLSLGVKDSKLLTDEKIKVIAPILMEKLQYSYRVLDNPTYNRLYKQHGSNINMNKIKAILHNFVLYNLVNKITETYEMIIIDAFTPQNKYFTYLKEQSNVIQNVRLIEKAEKLFTSVACASCIARYIFLKDWENLESKVGHSLPKGASHLVDEVGKLIVQEKGPKYLNEIAKVNFKNIEKILD